VEGAIVQQLKLDDLLRYGFCGGLFVLTLLLVHPASSEKLSQAKSVGEAGLLLGLVLLIGSLIYTLHRALTYPLVLFKLAALVVAIFGGFKFELALVIPFFQTKLERDMDGWRLELRRKQDALSGVIAEWGAQVHFLYCSGLSVLLALFVTSFFIVDENPLTRRFLFWSSALMMFGGFYHHVRLLRMIDASWTRQT
jgi:hypothetical protein